MLPDTGEGKGLMFPRGLGNRGAKEAEWEEHYRRSSQRHPYTLGKSQRLKEDRSRYISEGILLLVSVLPQTAHWHSGSAIHSKTETQLYLSTAKANQVLNNSRLFISKSASSSVPYVSS